MKKIKYRLYGIYLSIVAVFILLLYFLLSNVVAERLVSQEEEMLEHEIVDFIEYLENQPTDDKLLEEEIINHLSTVAPVIHERITYMDMSGEPLFDSEVPLNEMDNLINRIEVQQVLIGVNMGTSRNDRQSEKHLYHVAQAIYDQNEEPVGIIRLTNETTNLAATILLTFRILFIVIGFLGIIFILSTNRLIQKMTKAITEMKYVMNRLIDFDYGVKYTGSSYEEVDALGISINELAENLEEQQHDLKAGEERIHGLINHLILGVMLLDEDRSIQMVNPVMNELLGANLYGKISHLYTDHVRSAELIELIEKAYSKKQAVNAEIRLYLPDEKTLDANVIPVPGHSIGEQNFIVLLYDITEIQRLENIRTDFAANVSHELRTPITALKGFSETLLDGAMHDEEVLKEFLEIMLKESIRLDSMVQDILQLSKLERQPTRTSTEWMEVHEVIEEVFQILQQKIELKNITYYVEAAEDIAVHTNRDYLKQVLMNLIANAIIYTPENGTVIVDLDQIGDEVRIQIIDNGIGIPEEDQTRIFERFYRVDKARSRNSGGTGLGLSIVKWVVEDMKGRMELFSEVDVGTTFVVWLPINDPSDKDQ